MGRLTDAELLLLEFNTVSGGPLGQGENVGRPTPWWKMARDEQLPPDLEESGKNYWLVMAGRGWGKTRVGAEWTRWKANDMPGSLGALVAKDPGEARDVMIEGQSGLLACCPEFDRPQYNPSLKRITWRNGTRATIFSSEEFEELRGPQHHWLWGDEPAKWNASSETWEQAQFGLRLGANPEACLTTTPRPIKLIKELVKDPLTHLTSGTTYENKANLSPVYKSIIRKFEGTRLGRQELEAALLDDQPGALWTSFLIEQHRVPTAPYEQFNRIVIGVDPSAGSADSDELGAEAGIVACARALNQHGYVLGDATVRGRPEEWARAAVNLYRFWKADSIIAEANNGGQMVESVIRNVDASVPVKLVHASRGKITRAEPISALYGLGIIHHVGLFPELEDQMTTYDPLLIGAKMPSPDRMDALVWAVTELFPDGTEGMQDAFFGVSTLLSAQEGRRLM